MSMPGIREATRFTKRSRYAFAVPYLPGDADCCAKTTVPNIIKKNSKRIVIFFILMILN